MTDEPYVRDDVRALLTMLEQLGAPDTADGTPTQARARYDKMKEMADLPRPPLHRVTDLRAPGPAGPLPVRLYSPTAETTGTLILFFHGGGFVIGDLASHDGVCGEVARATGRPVLAVDYRLAPEHPFPAAPDDCETVARWAAECPAELGLTVTGLATCGDSAGGALAIVTARSLVEQPTAVPVLAQCPIYPVVDSGDWPSLHAFGEGYLLTARTMRWFFDHYAAPAGDPRHDLLALDHAGTVPTALMTAALDPLRDQGRAYAKALVDAGVTVRFSEAAGNLHGLVTLRKLVPSSVADLACLLDDFAGLLELAEAAKG